MSDDKKKSLKIFRRVNVDGTLNLARQAAEAGVSRFVFVSSIKVNGEVTQPGKPFRADDEPRPSDDYALSKLEAEQGLLHIAKQTKMELVIVRPPLVYGPGVKANFASLMKFIQLGLPMPLGAVNNSRSLVALSNLVDLLNICLKHPAAANQIFLASDGEDVSTTELLWRLGKVMNKKVYLMSIPVPIIDLVAAILCKTSVTKRLFSSLQVDIEKTRSLLSWNPPLTLNQGLKKILEDAQQ
jgi:nucleoside-diphosphate-sugar epimerase